MVGPANQPVVRRTSTARLFLHQRASDWTMSAGRGFPVSRPLSRTMTISPRFGIVVQRDSSRCPRPLVQIATSHQPSGHVGRLQRRALGW
jgi:hypothetical protein